VRDHLNAITELSLVTASNLVEATQDAGAFVQVSGVLKRVAVKLSKTCNDLRLLSSGPRGGLGEIVLPPVQAGSSIMPGKVNPVIPEVVNQVAFAIIGQDVTVSFAAEAGQLQLNAFEPIIALSLMRGLTQMRNAIQVLDERCVRGIVANEKRLAAIVEDSLALVTALNPVIGYEKATEVALVAQRDNATVRQAVLALGYMSAEDLDRVLDARRLAQAGFTK
jgi:aspartate ammonia-lyase